jgi:Helix-turn-helix domain
MSALATFWAQRQRPSGGPSALLVLLALADIHNDHTGECRPKVATLAARCMLSERQIQRTLGRLEKDGLIARAARYSKRGGYQIANGYRLAISVEKPCAPSPDTDVTPCKPSPDMDVTPYESRGDARVGAMGVTSTSPLEPTKIEPPFLRAPACDAEARRARLEALAQLRREAAAAAMIPAEPKRWQASPAEIETFIQQGRP